jgi:hypothetical protein
MQVWNVSADCIGHVVQAVSSANYDGNLIFKRLPETVGRAVRFTLTVRKAADPGGRRSNTGRKVCAACWHCHRDVMAAIMAIVPNARIKTAQADYRGREDFDDKFESTGHTNCGSTMEPLDYRDSCECEGETDDAVIQDCQGVRGETGWDDIDELPRPYAVRTVEGIATID